MSSSRLSTFPSPANTLIRVEASRHFWQLLNSTCNSARACSFCLVFEGSFGYPSLSK